MEYLVWSSALVTRDNLTDNTKKKESMDMKIKGPINGPSILLEASIMRFKSTK